MLNEYMKFPGCSEGCFIFLRCCGLILFASWGTVFSVQAVELITVRAPVVTSSAGANGASVSPQLSSDGRFIMFSSAASDLVTNDNAWMNLDVFLHDRTSNTTRLVSENYQHTGGGNDHSVGVCVSTNGRYVLFESLADDLVSGDANKFSDVFLRDCQTDTTILVSAATTGGTADNRSESATMTPDGRYVAFVSYATNMVAGDTNNSPDLFVRDLQTQMTTLVSVGATNANAFMDAPAISADGRWVAFFSSARGLVAGVSNNSFGEIYLRDVTTGTTLWPSANAVELVRSNMPFASTPKPMHPVLSADGRYVTFACGWTNNTTAPPAGTTPATVIMQFDATMLSTTVIATNGCPPALFGDEVYGPEATPDGRFVAYAARVTNGVSAYGTLRCWDRESGATVGVSVDIIGGVSSNRTSVMPVLSVEGRYVIFLSDATNLVNNTISNGVHLYRRDLQANTTELVDADLSGVGSISDLAQIIPVSNTDMPAVSADGRFIAYSAPDGNLVGTDANGFEDVFVRDMMVATNALISTRHSSLVPQSGSAAVPLGILSLSADGNRAVYSSLATNLAAGDTNQHADVFVWDRNWQSNQLVSVGLNNLSALGGPTLYPQISADGRYVLVVSAATNLVADDTNGGYDVFRRDLALQVTTRISVMTNGVSLGSYDASVFAMTPDAQRVVFMAMTNTASGIYPFFWRDLGSGETKLISSSVSFARPISVSTNGERVAFHNSAGTLFVWSAVSGATIYSSAGVIGSALISPSGNHLLFQVTNQLICYDLNGQSNLNSWPSNNRIKNLVPWSADERHVVFVTATSLIATDTNEVNDVYLCDLQTGTRTLLSANPNGVVGSAASDMPGFSADGRFITYRSAATNLLATPTTAPGLFRFDRVTGSNQLVVAESPVLGAGWFSAPAINANGTVVAFMSVDSGLVAGDLNRSSDTFASSLNVLSLADGDGDGIPDWWLQQYFSHSHGLESDLSRAADDADGDGLTNLQEFLAGTAPTDAASALEIQLVLTPPMGTNAVLSWPAQPGKNYQVQFSDNVAGGIWQNLVTPAQISGGQGWVTVSRTNQVRVFRVRCEP